MRHLTILIPNGDINLVSVIGSYMVFKGANRYINSRGKRDLFEVQLAGLSTRTHLHDGRFSIKPDVQLSAISKTHLIIIPALAHGFDEVIAQNAEMIRWIKAQHHKGAEIATICTGLFLLGPTGLLEGRKCSTHWGAANDFRKMFPGVDLVPDQLVTDEKGIYTNGGAFSFLNLLLYLVEKFYGRETAIYCSKVFQIDIERNSQSPFTIFTGQKGHEDEVIKKAQELMEKNPAAELSADTLAERFALSRRNFDRRFIKATGDSPAGYLRRVRIESAKRALETGDKQISEVMYKVGYADEKTFRTVFKKVTGLSPLEYRARYHKPILK